MKASKKDCSVKWGHFVSYSDSLKVRFFTFENAYTFVAYFLHSVKANKHKTDFFRFTMSSLTKQKNVVACRPLVADTWLAQIHLWPQLPSLQLTWYRCQTSTNKTYFINGNFISLNPSTSFCNCLWTLIAVIQIFCNYVQDLFIFCRKLVSIQAITLFWHWLPGAVVN